METQLIDLRKLIILALCVGLSLLGWFCLQQNLPEISVAGMTAPVIAEDVEPPPLDLPKPNPHALEGHGEYAELVDYCLRVNGREAQLLNQDTGRWMLPCKMPNGRYGVGIYEKVQRAGEWIWENVTAYPTRFITLGKVIDFLGRGKIIVVRGD